MDYRVGEEDMTHLDIQDHLAYVEKVAGERFFLGGGFSNIDGGMCLFEAKDFEDAQSFARNDPIIGKGFYRCDIYEWDLAVLSEDMVE